MTMTTKSSSSSGAVDEETIHSGVLSLPPTVPPCDPNAVLRFGLVLWAVLGLMLEGDLPPVSLVHRGLNEFVPPVLAGVAPFSLLFDPTLMLASGSEGSIE